MTSDIAAVRALAGPCRLLERVAPDRSTRGQAKERTARATPTRRSRRASPRSWTSSLQQSPPPRPVSPPPDYLRRRHASLANPPARSACRSARQLLLPDGPGIGPVDAVHLPADPEVGRRSGPAAAAGIEGAGAGLQRPLRPPSSNRGTGPGHSSSSPTAAPSRCPARDTRPTTTTGASAPAR